MSVVCASRLGSVMPGVRPSWFDSVDRMTVADGGFEWFDDHSTETFTAGVTICPLIEALALVVLGKEA